MAISKKKELYIEYELEFLEKKAGELKEYIEARPFSTLSDRMDYKENQKTGGIYKTVIASIEVQRKDLTQALKDYAEIIQTIDKFRQVEEAKQIQARGSQDITLFESGEI